MGKDDEKVPEGIKKLIRPMMLDQLRDTSILNFYELELFDWYVRNTEETLNIMITSERNCVQEQIDAKIEDINDSGILASEYYLIRVRYSHVIYMASLLETFLEGACEKLTAVAGFQNLPFGISELNGDKWSVKRKYLERYGKFTMPNDVWSEINALITLRNNLVHDNGSTTTLKPDDKKMLSKRAGLGLAGHNITIEAEFIHNAFNAMKTLTKFIEIQLSEFIDRAKRPQFMS